MSQRMSAFLALRNCSGAMKCGVPRPRPVRVRFRSASSSLTSPRSAQLGGAVRRHHDVVRLDVAVDQVHLVGAVQPLGHLGDDADRLGLGQPPVALDLLAQRLPLDELHHQIGDAAGLAEVEGADDVRVVQPAGGVELLLEALDQDGVAGHVLRHDLDGHDRAAVAAAGAVDGAHAALGDLLQQIVVADALHDGPGGVKRHRPFPR